jgi:hypothetical protein
MATPRPYGMEFAKRRGPSSWCLNDAWFDELQTKARDALTAGGARPRLAGLLPRWPLVAPPCEAGSPATATPRRR